MIKVGDWGLLERKQRRTWDLLCRKRKRKQKGSVRSQEMRKQLGHLQLNSKCNINECVGALTWCFCKCTSFKILFSSTIFFYITIFIFSFPSLYLVLFILSFYLFSLSCSHLTQIQICRQIQMYIEEVAMNVDIDDRDKDMISARINWSFNLNSTCHSHVRIPLTKIVCR